MMSNSCHFIVRGRRFLSCLSFGMIVVLVINAGCFPGRPAEGTSPLVLDFLDSNIFADYNVLVFRGTGNRLFFVIAPREHPGFDTCKPVERLVEKQKYLVDLLPLAAPPDLDPINASHPGGSLTLRYIIDGQGARKYKVDFWKDDSILVPVYQCPEIVGEYLYRCKDDSLE